jgi:hypothetical protein
MEDADDEDADYLLSDKRRKDEREVTEDLARQLGFQRPWESVVHETMLFVIPELDRLLAQWPLPEDNKECTFIVDHATKSLRPQETYALICAGPALWSKGQLPEGLTIGALAKHLDAVLRKGLTAALRSLFDRWTKWKVPGLHVQWREARIQRPPNNPVVKRAMTEAELLQRRAERKKFNEGAAFQPPGRTY